jgi:hypothetical protein
VIASLPRPLLIALVGIVAVAGIFVMTRGNSGGEAEPAAPPSPGPAPQASTPPKTSAATPGSATKPSTTQGSPSNATPAPARPAVGAKARTLPQPVKHALDAHKIVVLLFWSPRGTDDRNVKSAVDSLSRRGGDVAVFTDRSKNMARYAKITAAADVEQTPTLIVVNRKGVARRATGYLDSETVDQYVVDALHGAP